MLGKAAIARIVGEVTLGVTAVATTAEACKVPGKVRERTKDLQEALDIEKDAFDIAAEAVETLAQYLIKDHEKAIRETKQIKSEIQNLQKCAGEYKNSNNDKGTISTECDATKIKQYIQKIKEKTTK